jgi:hypothetical protein
LPGTCIAESKEKGVNLANNKRIDQQLKIEGDSLSETGHKIIS